MTHKPFTDTLTNKPSRHYVNNENTRIMSQACSNLATKTPEQDD